MEAKIRTLEDIFSNSVQLLVPLYQRPYVWEKGKQWAPLWKDVVSVAERLHEQLARGVAPKKAQGQVTPHFMGAVVLQQMHTAIGEMERYAVIDGQQRLTTLQILVDAVQAVVEHAGDKENAELLGELIVNTRKVKADDDRFKIWPTNVDRAAFREVMSAPPPVAHAQLDHPKARVVEAHAFFSAEAAEFVAEAVTPDDRRLRAHALTTVLLGMLTVVAIELERDENAQLIFETLNARNTPLLASDLVKNVLFQRVEDAEKGSSEALYEKHWRALDAEDWRKTVTQGRLTRPRLDLLLFYWLIMHTGRPVTTHEVFPVIRAMAYDAPSAVALLTAISANARRYDAFEHAPVGSPLEVFRYRVIDVMQADAVTPVLLWLHDPTRPAVPQGEVDLALSALESWSVRRMLCRLTTKDNNKVFIDLIEELGKHDHSRAGTITRAFLERQTADSRLWPSDSSVRDALAGAEVYRTLSRARLRMVLEALEDSLRTKYSEQRIDRGKYTIEHVLPQKWQKHWPLGSDEPVVAESRNHWLHTIGNLTLVTGRLNPKLSNGPWADKRKALAAHSVLRLNHDLLETAAETWTEQQIVARSGRLAELVTGIWAR